MFKTSAKRLSTYGAQECSKTTSAKRDVSINLRYSSDIFLFLSRQDAAVLSQRDGGLLKLAVGMVEDDAGVEAAALERGLEMEMLRRGATRAACETDDLAGLDLVAHIDEVFRLMTVERFQTPCVLDHDAEAITIIGA